MNIGSQWNDRLRMWAEQFPKHYYRKIAELPVSFFTTMEHIPFEQAAQGHYAPASVGMEWGRKWEYGWFRTQIVIPEALDGKRAVFSLNTAEEMLVWVNGRETGAIDRKHRFITLSRAAKAGESYAIHAECYAGHGVRNEGAGPVGWGEDSVPEPPEYQVTVGESHFGVWNEALFQAAMDYLTLYSLVQKLPEKSLRTMKIVEGLKKFTYIADFELPEPDMTASVIEADKLLKPLLACKNGSTMPEYTVFGQSHLDLAWLWPVEETMRKAARTYANQLALAQEYDDYRFLLCEPPIPEWLKELYPDVYGRVLEKVREGKFYPEGALWVESDTNIPSGESLIRQFVRGKRWFRAEMGVDSKMAWMPDTFGFSAALPQIMQKCQIPYFATQKLIRQPSECEPFPYNIFWWEGMDGSRVLAHTFKKNNADFRPGDLITRWEVKYFERHPEPADTFRGELYLAWHRGALTSQAKTKKGIRDAENALRQAEFFLARHLLLDRKMPDHWKRRLDALWKKLLFNQFHDIATGTSIAKVHARAEKELHAVCEGCRALMDEMRTGSELAQGSRMVCNCLSWPRRICGVTVPAQSSAAVELSAVPEHPVRLRYLERENCYELSNAYLVCRINGRGELVSVKKQGSETEYLAGAGNRLLMFKDVNTCYDAWELGSMYENMPVPAGEDVRIAMHAGACRASLEINRKIGASDLTQEIVLTADAESIAFVTKIDWRERHKLLKVTFAVNTHAEEAMHEIQFGYVKRPTHRSYQTDKDRYEVCNHRYSALTDGAHGAAVLNDGKYGVNVADNEIRLTLLKSAMMPDQYADRGMQHFTYAFYPFDGAFADSDVPQKAAEQNEPEVVGGIADDLGFILLTDAKNIIVDTIKPADTADNALMVRVYESMGKQTDCAFTINTKMVKIVETDMLEEYPEAVDVSRVHFGSFEIKTFLLYF